MFNDAKHFGIKSRKIGKNDPTKIENTTIASQRETNMRDTQIQFFFLESGIDSGPIIEQIKFSVTDNDDAESVTDKMLEAEKQALDSLLPVIKKYKIKSKKQDFESASWFWKRSPEDGLIDWSEDATKIDKLSSS